MTATPNRPTLVCRMGDLLVNQLSRLTTQNLYDRSTEDYSVIALTPHEHSEAAPHALIWALPGTELAFDDNVEAVVKQIAVQFRYARGLTAMRYWSIWPHGRPDALSPEFAAYEAKIEPNGQASFGDTIGIVELARVLGLPVAMLRALLPKEQTELNEPFLKLEAA